VLPRIIGAVLVIAVSAGATPALAGGPTRPLAARYAKRTYVNDPNLGRRHFGLIGSRETVTAADDSTISAFAAVLDSADGTGQIVLLFRGRRFLGWASAYDTLRLSLSASGTTIRVRYGVFRGNDPFCCPSSLRTVSYRWNGSRIVASGQPPSIYGRHGTRLHLVP
jgi:hypothetical protein